MIVSSRNVIIGEKEGLADKKTAKGKVLSLYLRCANQVFRAIVTVDS